MSKKTTKNIKFSVGHIWFPKLSYEANIPKNKEEKVKDNERKLKLIVDLEDKKIDMKRDMGEYALFRFSSNFIFEVKVDIDKNSGKNIFNANGIIEGDLILGDKNITEQKLYELFDENLNKIVFPYIRSTIDDLLVKSGLPPFGMVITY